MNRGSPGRTSAAPIPIVEGPAVFCMGQVSSCVSVMQEPAPSMVCLASVRSESRVWVRWTDRYGDPPVYDVLSVCPLTGAWHSFVHRRCTHHAAPGVGSQAEQYVG